MPVPLLFALPPLLTWAAGGAVATGAVVGAAALDRRTDSRNANATSTAGAEQTPDHAIGANPPSAQPPRAITEEHTAAIRSLEAALVNLMTTLQTQHRAAPSASQPGSSSSSSHHDTSARRTSTAAAPNNIPPTNTSAQPRSQSTILPPNPLDPLLIWTRRVTNRLSEIRIGRDAETVAQSICERLDELVRRMVMAQALFQGEEWRAIRALFVAVDEVGRVLGRRVVGVVDGVVGLGEVDEGGEGRVEGEERRRLQTADAAAVGHDGDVSNDMVREEDGAGEDESGGVSIGGAGGNVDLARIT